MRLTYCADLVRQYDPDRYLFGLLYPQDKREALWTLFAFYNEIAKTREVVSETATGLIRLQWWREAIEKIYAGEVLEHEVIKPLANVIQMYELERDVFDHLIYAREFDVEDRQPSTLDGMKKYAEFTGVPLNQLCLKVLDEEASDDILRNASVFYGCVGLLRAVPFHLSQRRCYLPEDLMSKYEVSVSKLYDWKKFDLLRPVVKEVLDKISAFAGTTSFDSRFLRANYCLAQLYKNQIATCGYDVFDPKIQAEPAFKALRVWWGSF